MEKFRKCYYLNIIMNIILFSSMNIPLSTTLKHYYNQATKISIGVIMKNTEILDHLKTKKICEHAVEKWLS